MTFTDPHPFDPTRPEDWCRPNGPDKPSRLWPDVEDGFCQWARTHPRWPVPDPDRVGQGWAAFGIWARGKRGRGEVSW